MIPDPAGVGAAELDVHVLISGYYGFHNAGDEAVLAGIIAGLRRAVGNVAQPPSAVSGISPAPDITVLSRDPVATARDHGVRAINRMDRGAVARELRGADLLISGGGNLLQDATSARSSLYYLWVIRAALRARVPVVALGQGIGPLRRWWLRALVRRYLNRVRGIALRDAESARELERLGVNRTLVRVGADLSLALNPPDGSAVARAWAELGISDPRNVLAVAPRSWRIGGVGEQVMARLVTAITRAAADMEPSPQIVVFPMQRPQDDQAGRDLAAAVGGRFAETALDAPLLAAMIGQTRATVAMRLHALIFAATGGSLPVAVSYDPKIEAFMTDLGFPTAATIADLSEERLAEAIIAAWQADDAERAALRAAVADRRRVVDDTFAWALDMTVRR